LQRLRPVTTPANPEPVPPEAGERPRTIQLRRYLPLAVVAALTVLVVALGWHRELSLENLVKYRSEIDQFIADHRVAAIGVFMAIYIAVVSLSIPGAVYLTVGGGILFGAIVGALATIVAATVGAIVIFLIARSAFGENLTRRAGPFVAKLADGFRADAFNYLLFLRLVTIFPFWLVNLAAALFNVPLWTFAAATAIGIIPGTFTFAFVGAGLDSVIAAQQATYEACVAAGRSDCRLDFNVKAALTPELILSLVALGVLALVPVVVRRWRARGRPEAG
jgi:uncharacterized membrane protein YdjX (TVP38/TMEM64 family)